MPQSQSLPMSWSHSVPMENLPAVCRIGSCSAASLTDSTMSGTIVLALAPAALAPMYTFTMHECPAAGWPGTAVAVPISSVIATQCHWYCGTFCSERFP